MIAAPARLAGIAAGLVILAGTAAAHHAPSGWMYSALCCHDRDCGQEHVEVVATGSGWLITSTGETIPFADKRIKESQDEFFHRCFVSEDGRDTGKTRCLYVPPFGS